MRYFLLCFALTVVVVVAIAGKRGQISRRPPIEVFPDMDRQPKLRPQTEADFFADGLSSRLPVPGTIARATPRDVGGRAVYPFEEHAVNTGRVPGGTNYVETTPLPVTAQRLARGQERYTIYCAPCHGAEGDGKSITAKLGMAVIASLHDATGRKVVQQPDGELFHTITYGKNLMGAYGGLIPVEDRWAIIAYVRALQRSRLATMDDVPADQRAALPSPPPPAAPAAPTP
jgi:mono/diheme cytochrome c family protein